MMQGGQVNASTTVSGAALTQGTRGPGTDAGKGRANGAVQVVEFLLGREHFAIDLFDVREVVEYTRITRLPNAPPYIKGIIDLRGEITIIIDLKEALSIPDPENRTEEESRIIVLDDKITTSKTGIMVDDVLSVSTYSESQVDSSLAGLHHENTPIIGIIKKKTRVKEKDGTELIIWIDIRHLLKAIEQGKGEFDFSVDAGVSG
jgi:purine-binding chemotaxis protein CheW